MVGRDALFRVAAAGERVEVPAVPLGVGDGGEGDIAGVVGGGVLRSEVEDDADLGTGRGGPDRLSRQPVREEQVVAGGQGPLP
ncbi:MAG: hypothetical protein A2V75_10410 [Actinobacteria bacterium RBG_16_70_17]|nr:MAG: hypothetical protein A2V75_10410 [Actinobacteria bacterium RBG_16_70_17]